jgi:ADP-heptose:LPS heptosyltransferase
VSFNPRNILVLDFGQLGDVVLSLPALKAIREKFPQARVTVASGKACIEIVELSGFADATIEVDRVAIRDKLREGSRLLAIGKALRVVQKVRRGKFDFVIDLHSLPESNLLGFLSGAPLRLFGRRGKRSIDWLSNFEPQPPVEDTSKHATDRYLDALLPLGVKDAQRIVRLVPRDEDAKTIEKLLHKHKIDSGVPLVGLFPGAGHESRRWPIERFAEVADRLTRNLDVQVIVFAGPEEKDFGKEMRGKFPTEVLIFDKLTLKQLAAAMVRLSVLVSNDTGPMHVAAAVGTPVVKLIGHPTLNTYIPIGDEHRVIYSKAIDEITVEEVYETACETLTRNRTQSIIAE